MHIVITVILALVSIPILGVSLALLISFVRSCCLSVEWDMQETTSEEGVSQETNNPTYPQESARWELIKSTMRARDAFHMDPRGNLTLKIGTDTGPKSDRCAHYQGIDEDKDDGSIADQPSRSFLVCSKALARSSCVFRKMLFGDFAEATKEVISLPEDHAEPMFLALSIIHGRFANVPASLTIAELFELLVTTNKHDMTGIVRPWIHSWVPGLKDIDQCPDKDLLAWIAWEVGAEIVFEKTIFAMANEFRLNDNGDIVNTRGEAMRMNVHVDAAGIPNTVARARDSAISKLLGYLQVIGYLILVGRGCLLGKGSFRCDDTVFGSIVMACKAADVDHIRLLSRKTLSYPNSIRELRTAIKNTEFTNYRSHMCNTLDITKLDAEDVFERISSPISSDQLDHLRNQAKISGWARLD